MDSRSTITDAFAAQVRISIERAFVRPTDAIDVAVGEVVAAAENWREAMNEPTPADPCGGPCCGGPA
jgi:hypothetical protein